jgi:hypothetical protein
MLTSMKRRTQAERDQRALWFADEPAVLSAASAAALAQQTPELTQPVAYCLVALAVKDDGPRMRDDGTRKRSYELDPGSASLPAQLSHWAGRMAANLAKWAGTYETILDELADRRVTTLSGMIRLPVGEHDVRDVIADTLATKLAYGPRVAHMTIARAREGWIPANQYAFQSPLPQWVQTGARRSKPRAPALTPPEPEVLRGDDLIRHEEAIATELLRDTAALVARLRETRGLLSETVDRALSASVDLKELMPAHVAPELWPQIKRQLVGVIDDLVAERRAMTGMLSFITLAMHHAAELQCVTAVSLRLTKNDPAAVAEMTARMHALLEDDQHPTPMLVAQTRAASFTNARSRVAAMESLRAATPGDRAAALAPVTRMLGGLPESVTDLRAIADAATSAMRAPSRPPISYEVVRTYRGDAFTELGSVDVRYEAVYGRYASTRRRR